VRDDGVYVTCVPFQNAAGDEAWVAVRPGRLPVLLCPCCGRAMTTLRAAQLVADAVFPRQAVDDGQPDEAQEWRDFDPEC
jgi:hypothetical protein